MRQKLDPYMCVGCGKRFMYPLDEVRDPLEDNSGIPVCDRCKWDINLSAGKASDNAHISQWDSQDSQREAGDAEEAW